LASGTGTAIRSRRLIVTPGRFSGVPFAERFSTHFRRPSFAKLDLDVFEALEVLDS
jgi:hypothetical protein